MRQLYIFVTVMFMVSLTSPGTARDSDTTRYLLAKCKMALSDKNDPISFGDANYCFGYLTGMLDAWFVADLLLSPKICIPATVTLGQKIAVFVKWAEANPAEWHHPAIMGVVGSLSKAFPCPKK